MRPRAYLLLFLLIPLLGLVIAGNAAAASTRPWVFMLAGQSNMEGRGGPIPTQKPDPRIIRQGEVGKRWTIARDPLQGFGVGPGMSFAETLLERHPRARIVLVPCAKGGTTIAAWQSDLYRTCVARMRDAIRNHGGVAKGILFDQGEADAYTIERGIHWADYYKNMIGTMRRALAAPLLPVVHAVIARNELPAYFPAWDLVKSQQRRQLNRHDVAVETEDLPMAGFPHYSVSGYRSLGRRMARAWIADSCSAPRRG